MIAAESLKVREAGAAFAETGTLSALVDLEKSEAEWLAAITEARRAWAEAQINFGPDASYSAEINANETMAEIGETDDLTWLRLAFQTIILTPAAR